MHILQLGLLGSWQAWLDGTPLPPLPTRHARVLLARLALAHPHSVHRSTLLHDIFPHAPQDAAARHLRTTLYYARRTLAPILVSTHEAIGLAHNIKIVVDVHTFDKASKGTTINELLEAVELYRGVFLGKHGDGWAGSEADRLHIRYIDTLRRLVTLAQAGGAWEVVITASQKILAEEPWDAQTHLDIIEAYIKTGHRDAAERQILRARTDLRRDGPSEQLATLSRFARAAARLPRNSELAVPNSDATLYHLSQNFDHVPLVGRDTELRYLHTLWGQARQGRGTTVVVEGVAGIGKSRLLNEVVAQVRLRADTVVLSSIANEQTQDQPFGALRQMFTLAGPSTQNRIATALRTLDNTTWNTLAQFDELHTLLPDRPTSSMVWLDAQTQAAGRVEAMLHLLTRLTQHGALLLALEDGHQADEETLNLVRHFNGSSFPILTIITARPATSMATFALPSITLLPLTDAAINELVRGALGTTVNADLLERIQERSGGIPLFARELLHILLINGILHEEASGWQMVGSILPLPDPVTNLLAERLAPLSTTAQELAGLIAILGRPADRELLALLHPDEQTRNAAQHELVNMRILDERRTTLQFNHAWLQERLRASLSEDQVRCNHHRIANALACLDSHDWSERMRHEVGAGHRDRALATALNAAEVAWSTCRLPAMAQALSVVDAQFEHLGQSVTAEDQWKRLGLRESYLSLVEHGSTWSSALTALMTFAGQSQRVDWQIIALTKNGRGNRERGRLLAAEGPLYRAARLAHSHAFPELEARARISLAAVHEDRGDVEQALSQAIGAVSAAEISGNTNLRLHAQGVLAYMQMRAGMIDEAAALNTRVLDDPALELSPLLQARFTRHHGIIHIAARRYEAGIGLLRESIRLSQRIGDSFGLVTCQTSLTWYLAVLGQSVESDALAEATRDQAKRLHAEAHLVWLALAQGLNAHTGGDFSIVRSFAVEAEEHSLAADDPEGRAIALGLIARSALHAGDLQRAQSAIEDAQQVLRTVSHPSVIATHIAASVALACGQHDKARELAHEAIAAVECPGLAAIYTNEVLWDAAQVITKVDGQQAGTAIQTQAFRLFLHDLSCIRSSAARRAFIKANDAHRAIAALGPRTGMRLVLLPASDAPTGRPLHPEELVPVVWTLPADASSHGAPQRRDWLHQLICQAHAQDASPTIEALAYALAVASRTVQRDLHILRKTGLELETRGSPKSRPG